MAKLLDFMVNCRNAGPDAVAEDLLRMAEPESFETREDMGDHFEDCLGYNPLEYFDRVSVEDEFEKLVNIAPFSVQDQLRNKREDIINRAISTVGDLNDTVLHKVILGVIQDTVGWIPVDPDAVSMDDCITMAIFGDEELEDETEPDEEDDEEDGLDDDLYEVPSDEEE